MHMNMRFAVLSEYTFDEILDVQEAFIKES
jgi:hypothetical protein